MHQQAPSVGITDSTSAPSRRWYQFTIWHLLVAMTLLAGGFAILENMQQPEPVGLQGRVMVDENPLSNGVIVFVLTSGKKKQRFSQQIRNGAYAFSRKIEPGVYSVEISSPKSTGDVTVETIPPKYNSNTTLTVQLAPGSNTMDFLLNIK